MFFCVKSVHFPNSTFRAGRICGRTHTGRRIRFSANFLTFYCKSVVFSFVSFGVWYFCSSVQVFRFWVLMCCALSVLFVYIQCCDVGLVLCCCDFEVFGYFCFGFLDCGTVQVFYCFGIRRRLSVGPLKHV